MKHRVMEACWLEKLWKKKKKQNPDSMRRLNERERR